MQRALALAAEAARDGEVPVGAVVTHDGRIIGEGVNRTRRNLDPSAHAEIVAIRMSCKALETDRLTGCELWVTLEPCAMCAGAIAHARIDRLIYAAPDPKGGGVDHGARVFAQPTCHHQPDVLGGIGESAAAALLRDFFATLR
jgi:tRNA(Arg) A34 adenosine deaminase TadA